MRFIYLIVLLIWLGCGPDLSTDKAPAAKTGDDTVVNMGGGMGGGGMGGGGGGGPGGRGWGGGGGPGRGWGGGGGWPGRVTPILPQYIDTRNNPPPPGDYEDDLIRRRDDLQKLGGQAPIQPKKGGFLQWLKNLWATDNTPPAPPAATP